MQKGCVLWTSLMKIIHSYANCWKLLIVFFYLCKIYVMKRSVQFGEVAEMKSWPKGQGMELWGSGHRNLSWVILKAKAIPRGRLVWQDSEGIWSQVWLLSIPIVKISDAVKSKGKEEYLYSTFLAKEVHSKRSGMDHTFYLQITPCLPFLREHSPDGTTTTTEAVYIQLQLTTHLSTPERMKGWVSLVGWPIADGLPT